LLRKRWVFLSVLQPQDLRPLETNLFLTSMGEAVALKSACRIFNASHVLFHQSQVFVICFPFCQHVAFFLHV